LQDMLKCFKVVQHFNMPVLGQGAVAAVP